MRGYIEIKEDVYDDTIEHLQRLKTIACKMIKKLSESSDIYDRKRKDDDEDEELELVERRKGRYNY